MEGAGRAVVCDYYVRFSDSAYMGRGRVAAVRDVPACSCYVTLVYGEMKGSCYVYARLYVGNLVAMPLYLSLSSINIICE